MGKLFQDARCRASGYALTMCKGTGAHTHVRVDVCAPTCKDTVPKYLHSPVIILPGHVIGFSELTFHFLSLLLWAGVLGACFPVLLYLISPICKGGKNERTDFRVVMNKQYM